MQDIKSMTPEELRAYLKELGQPDFRAKQIFQWLHKPVTSFDEMSNLPKKLRFQLAQECFLSVPQVERKQVSVLDGTIKYLWRLEDGNCIETVLMRYQHGNTVCVSCQVGCNMGCVFCASTRGGKVRDLKASEILDQVLFTQLDSGEAVSNIVMMGIGEPLDNFENVKKFIRMLSDEHGLNISQRNITLSTCGLVPRIRELAEEDLQITLALSLHASSQEKRKELMPIANRYELSEVLDACRYYYSKTGRRLTFEYSLVGGVNDTREDAKGLADLVKGLNCHINLIPVNPIKERDYVQSDQKTIMEFKNKLEKYGINVTIRREMGRDINGACGQLRRSYMEQDENTEDTPESGGEGERR